MIIFSLGISYFCELMPLSPPPFLVPSFFLFLCPSTNGIELGFGFFFLFLGSFGASVPNLWLSRENNVFFSFPFLRSSFLAFYLFLQFLILILILILILSFIILLITDEMIT